MKEDIIEIEQQVPTPDIVDIFLTDDEQQKTG